jgi:hypothetical protein
MKRGVYSVCVASCVSLSIRSHAPAGQCSYALDLLIIVTIACLYGYVAWQILMTLRVNVSSLRGVQKCAGGFTMKFEHGSNNAPFVVEGEGKDLSQRLPTMVWITFNEWVPTYNNHEMNLRSPICIRQILFLGTKKYLVEQEGSTTTVSESSVGCYPEPSASHRHSHFP